MKQINIIGEEFERLKVLKFLRMDKYRRSIYLCKCNCGNIIEASRPCLINKKTKSCGCLNDEVRKSGIAHLKHGMTYTQFYNIWANMKQRCNNIRFKYYKHYGGRGIIYNKRWNNFINFKKDMYFKYVWAKKKFKDSIYPLSIERMNVNGNYCFENCIFIPKNEQAFNRRPKTKKKGNRK
jgi:hypothetical protein